MKPFLLSAFVCIVPLLLRGQEVGIKGTIRDGSGEVFYLANAIILPDSVIATSDTTGTFIAKVATGLKTIIISYTGFESITTVRKIERDTVLNFVLRPKVSHLQEILIEEKRYSNEDVFESTVSGTQTLMKNDLLRLPSFMGEADLLQAVRLLPGSVAGMEGSSDLFVRGGAADQNLVLLDDGPLYNPGHLFGFLSVFNPDILDKADIIHGGFPAEFGGRLSSVLNISSISEMAERTSLSADVGLIASRIKLEQPIVKDKASFWIAGRKSYVDKLVQKTTGKQVPYTFFDLNGKVIVHPSKSHQIEMSHYSAGDDLDFLRDIDGDGRGMHTIHNTNNSSQTFKWSHRNAGNWRNNLSMFHTVFGYNTRNAYKEDYRVSASSHIEDFGVKISVEKDSVWGKATLNTGFEWIRHEISPKVLNSQGSISDLVESGASDGKIVQEYALYVQQEWVPARRLTVNAGLRASMASTASSRYINPEPRLSGRYALRNEQALKFNYSRMVQYLHRISNSAVSTPIDVWFPVTDSIGPQTSHQFAVAWQRFSPLRKIYVSVEAYYKSMQDLVAYEEGTNLLFRSDFESRLIQGKGSAYGSEFLIRKEAGKLTGWVSYSVSWSLRNYDALNAGEWFRARYDRRHNGAIVAQYSFAKRWMASLLWEYISGARFTPIVGQHLALAPNGSGLELIPVFSKINSVKLTDSHRLDVGLKLHSKSESRFKWNLFVGVYNVYNRATPFGIIIKKDREDNSLTYSQPGLFGLLPFVSYGCKLN